LKRVSGREDRVLDHTVKDHERMLREYEWNIPDIWEAMKRPNLQIISVEEGEEIKTKGIDHLLLTIIAENFPNLEKERVTQVQEACRTPLSEPKEKHPQTQHNQNTQHTEQRKISESCKGVKTSHI
jgi:hypothetical protein